MPKPISLVDIFVGEIDAAGKSNTSVDYCDFSVISVVLNTGEKGTEWIENAAGDAVGLQFPFLMRG